MRCDIFNFAKNHKKTIITVAGLAITSVPAVYYFLKNNEESSLKINEKWEDEYINKVDTLKKKHEYLLSAYSSVCQSRMKKYLLNIIEIIDKIYDIESLKKQVMEAETSGARAKAFKILGKTVIARDISFSIITSCMIFALECQANVIAHEMANQSKFNNSSNSVDSEALYIQTFLRMISLFISENNLKNITKKVNEIVFVDMEPVDLKKSFTKKEFIDTLVVLGKAVLRDNFFQNISDKFVSNMNFVRQQEIELVILFENYVYLLKNVCKNNLLELLVERYLTNFGFKIFSKIESDNCYYIGLIPQISETYNETAFQNGNLNVNDIICDIQKICYDKLTNKA
ncbi:Hypothetical protein SRAE_1000127800 [Strongyloides ratti]|uniref:Peroxisomal assembly protein PEX3 n=1 Tax=Strongyloides ratti TaxID=34506 RepID=A0A090L4G4_STRRB|nr:Hypothetical protein SRAE_1000127800 [Strongyloides ratti]CEF63012.1 Hypothetical protein SRAE_1000127800 [Strongyloides ratti]